ncbi:NAD(P)-binding oxidoreductase [Flavivirga abyssicola]|uniref:NAD(P)-dependent oxidoreductase n=1 Tax=Flavivirga abyssicola TaxID=3063533 RepID=UPI0026DFD4D6|nr:NAD(P)-binding oxidoreductase [Flavivirga sp. MEBiC07777]WVK13370.1 NAD(P)-binding oxidoreductase [Flavivirga sp. MEBiC07777]
MKVVIFGSTGTIGKHLIEQSLEKGHQVLAFCRDAEKLNIFSNPNLKIKEGDVFNVNDVESAVKGQDIVIIALGSGKDRKSVVRSQGTKNIIAAMEDNGVNRLICQSTLGTYESNNNLNFFWKYIMFGWYLKQIFLDHELQERYVKNSDLNWTIVRPGAFTNGEKTELYRHGFGSKAKSLKLKISRADVADFVLKQIGNSRYLHKSPGLSY